MSRRRVKSSTIEEASKGSRVIEESKPEVVSEEKPQVIEEEEEREGESNSDSGSSESEGSLSGEIVEIHEAAAQLPLVKLFSVVRSGSYSVDGEYLVIRPEHDSSIELLKIPLRELNSTVNVLIKARAKSVGELKKLKNMLQLEKLKVRVITEVEV